MATRRKEVFLATKVQERDGEEAMRIVEGSLKRLQTDQVDLIHIHALMDEEDLARIEKKGGPLVVLLKMRDQKITKNIGITCHHDPTVLKLALERHDFDCTQMAKCPTAYQATTNWRSICTCITTSIPTRRSNDPRPSSILFEI